MLCFAGKHTCYIIVVHAHIYNFRLHTYLLVNAKHCGASLRKCHPLQSSHTRRRHSSFSVVQSECEALGISEVGAITAEELVARIQSDQRRGPERLECHNDRVYCVCAHAQAGCAFRQLPSQLHSLPRSRGQTFPS